MGSLVDWVISVVALVMAGNLGGSVASRRHFRFCADVANHRFLLEVSRTGDRIVRELWNLLNVANDRYEDEDANDENGTIAIFEWYV